jgi:hypothetical protein
MSSQMLIVGNPSKRRRKKKTSSRKVATARPASKRKAKKTRARKRTRLVHRNPIKLFSGGIMKRVVNDQLKPAAIQATGALLVDAGYGFAGKFLPVQLTAGNMSHVTKGALAILLSTVAANLKIVGAGVASQLARGSLTVVLHDVGKDLIGQFAPSIQLGYYNSSPVMSRLSGFRRRSALSGAPATLYRTPATFPSMSTTGINRTGIGVYTGAPRGNLGIYTRTGF